jgi:hypothetical protein
MITFIKRLLGLAPNPVKTQEEVKAIFIPQMTTAAPNSAKTLEATYLAPAKPTTVAKVRAISETGSDAVKAATAPKPANKKRRPYRGNKVKAGATAAKVGQPKPAVTQGNTKGGNNVVKLQQPAKVAKSKPALPKAPVANKK